MVSATHTNRLPLTALLIAAGLVAGFLLFWRTASPLSARSGVDLDFLYPPLFLWTCLMLLGRIVVWARHSRLNEIIWRPALTGEGLRMATVLVFLQKLLTDLAWFALVLATLAALPAMTVGVADRTGGEGIASIVPYTHVFSSIALWGTLVLVPVAVVRALAEVRPGVRALLAPPWTRLAALGVGYALLANGGILDVAIGFEGFTHWLALGVVLGLSYGALVLRRMLSEPVEPRILPVLRVQLLLVEGAWIAIALGAVAGLPSVVESVLVGHFSLDGTSAAAYVASLSELTSPRAFAVMLPFALVRVAGVFRPTVDGILGFPVGRLVLLAAVYVLFSGNGVLEAALQILGSQLMAVLTLALALSYAASIMRNVSGIETPRRIWAAAAASLGLASSVATALAAGMTVWVFLNHLPVINAVLLDHESTRDIGRLVPAYFSALFDARTTVAALGAALSFAWSLPWASDDGRLFRVRPLLNAVCYSATGLLAWIAGSTLSPLGHGFVLAGAALASGMLVLALTQVLGYARDSRSAVLGPVARWLIASKVRGVVLGGAVAAYGLLLRPVLYETLWFAALYEYIALLAMLVIVLMFVMELLRQDAGAPDPQETEWSEWSHHQQTLESKADPRSDLTAAMRQRFVDLGDWKPVWSYLMVLLYRNGASQEWMRAVCRTLRASAVSSTTLPFLERSNLRRLGRASALAEALRRTDNALSVGPEPMQPVTDDELRMAAAQFVETGANVERLAVALIIAHCQQGRDLHASIDRWFPLLDAPDPSSGRFNLPWARSNSRLRHRHERVWLVDGAAAMVFGAASGKPDVPDPTALLELAGVSGASNDSGPERA